MIAFRDRMARELGFDLIVHTNVEAAKAGVSPFTHGSRYTDVMKTEALKAALSKHKFDAAFGGARRDEEKSRAKERVFSFRDNQHRWDPKNQRPGTVEHLQRAHPPGREHPRVPALELDRARRVALHTPREDPGRAAVLRQAAPGRGPRRHADHGRRRPHAAEGRREAAHGDGALPQPRLLSAVRRAALDRRPTSRP